jgi:hypothetical protein
MVLPDKNPAFTAPVLVPLRPFQSLLPVPFRGGYPVAGILLKMSELYTISCSGSCPNTIVIFLVLSCFEYSSTAWF